MTPIDFDAGFSPPGATQRRWFAAGMYAGKLTLQEVGDRLGVTRERVRQLLDDIGFPRTHKVGPKPVLSDGLLELLGKLLEVGWTHGELAGLVGTSKSLVAHSLYRKGLKPLHRRPFVVKAGRTYFLCRDCDTWKRPKEFGVARSTRDGKHSYCKSCTRRRAAEYQYRDREAYLAYARKYQREYNRRKAGKTPCTGSGDGVQ